MIEKIIEEVERISDEELDREWLAMAGKKRLPTPRLRWLMVIGLSYHRAIAELRALNKVVSATMWRRYKLAKEMDARGLEKESYFLSRRCNSNTTKGDTMKTKKGNVKKESKVTASGLLIKLLGAEKVKSDEALIATVKEATGSKLFDEKQLAWYKWKYRNGKLKGMNGKPHVIREDAPKKAKKRELAAA